MRLPRFSISSGHYPDYAILIAIFILVAGGLLFLSSASSDLSKIKYDDTYYFLKSQIIKGLIPGIIGFLAGYFIYYRKLRKAAPLLFIINLILLALVFSPIGKEVNGSHRWIEIGNFSFQPSEFLKITFLLYLASLLSSPSVKKIKEGWKTYFLFVFVSAITALLILIQPATTMAIIILGAGAVVYFFSGASFKQIAITVLIAVVFIVGLAFVTPYRFSRLAPFWNDIAEKISPSLKIEDQNIDKFHLNQSLISIGTGGLTGVGFGKSTSKYSVLPEPMGDSIFSVIAEESGFIGSLAVIFLFGFVFWRGTRLVAKSHDEFAKLLVLGFISVISIQAIIHIAANSGILPFTGITLPFISYGGTSLAVTLTMLGIISNVSKFATLER